MDKEAFASVVLSATDSLYRISKSILKNDTDCEDAVQEAIATGFSKLNTLRQETYAKTWLTRILIHECYSLLKSEKKLLLCWRNQRMKYISVQIFLVYMMH